MLSSSGFLAAVLAVIALSSVHVSAATGRSVLSARPPAPPPPNNPAYPEPNFPDAPQPPAPLNPAYPEPNSPDAPPPPPTTGFPWCACDTETYNTPFNLVMNAPVETATSTFYSASFIVNGCDPSISPCCDMDAYKVELHIHDQCKYSIGNITVTYPDGTVVKRSPTFQNYGTGKLVTKFTGMTLDYTNAEGVTIGFSLWKSKACPTWDSFLAEPRFAIVDKAIKCCPVFNMFGRK